MRHILKAINLLIAVSLLLIFVTVILEVLFRYVLHLALPWGAELSQTLLVWSAFLGSAYALWNNEHMAVSLFIDRVKSTRKRKILGYTSKFMLLFFLIVGVWAGMHVVAITWSDRTTAMQIPAGILYLSFPISCGLMAAFVVIQLFSGRKEKT